MTSIATPARRRLNLLAAGTLVLGTLAAGAQYSTPVGQGAARPKTLRATAVLEWTGTLEKPNASRLMPIAVWDGERYQPASLYLAKPEPLAFVAGTLYVLEHAGVEAGLFEVQTPAQLQGQWIGMGKFKPAAPPPPPKKLKVSKELPVLEGGKHEKDKSGDDDRPTLHRAPGSGTSTAGTGSTTGSSAGGSSGSAPANTGGTSASGGDKPAPSQGAGKAGDDAPTLHRRTDASSGGEPGDAGTGSSSASRAPDVDPDRPTLHKHGETSDAKPADDADDDSDRPTLHRARTAGGLAAASPTIDPDRPRLRHGASGETGESLLPSKLEGAPPAMQQIVAVSDAAAGEPHPYTYQWPEAGDAAKMQAALAQLAAQAVAAPAAAANGDKGSFGPQAAKARAAASAAKAQASGRASGRTGRAAKAPSAPAGPSLVDEKFAAFELSFSGGATLVYSAHTAADGPDGVYVTLVAQPDFYGKPQVLFQQVSHADRLAESPAMQLVDAVDTDGDGRAELVFSLTGPSATRTVASAGSGQSSASLYAADAAGTERQFAIYRVASGRVQQVFATGPLP